ncbi:Hypothetical predicted protein [Mytilus galloprovincialis]|uniref:Uncharacterized protein n=1 Tax=Mytilus galloprovincialis TaxID=29158 RepID=A0A8B6H3U0_MYTGA|nr:Hypothetical predicted protein [Mytilus galloprovincialis]
MDEERIPMMAVQCIGVTPGGARRKFSPTPEGRRFHFSCQIMMILRPGSDSEVSFDRIVCMFVCLFVQVSSRCRQRIQRKGGVKGSDNRYVKIRLCVCLYAFLSKFLLGGVKGSKGKVVSQGPDGQVASKDPRERYVKIRLCVLYVFLSKFPLGAVKGSNGKVASKDQTAGKKSKDTENCAIDTDLDKKLKGRSKFQSRWQMSSNSMEDVYLDLQPSPRLCHVSNQAARIAAGMKINYYIDLQTSLRLCHERNNAIFVQEAGQSKFQSRWQMSSNSMEDVYLNLQPSPRLCHVSNQAARIAAGMKINNYIDLQTSLRLCHERNNAIFVQEAGQSKFQSRWQMSSNSMEDVYLNLQPSPRLCHVSNQAARIAAGMKINNYIDLQTSLRLCHERNNAIFVQEAGQSKFQSRWQMSSNSMEDVYLNLQPSPRLCHVSNQAARIAAGMKINNYIDLQTSLRLCHERNNASIFKPINSVHYQEKCDKVYKEYL